MATKQHANKCQQAKEVSAVEEEEDEDDRGRRDTSPGGKAGKTGSKGKVENFKAPLLPDHHNTKSPPTIKLNGHLPPGDLTALSRLSIENGLLLSSQKTCAADGVPGMDSKATTAVTKDEPTSANESAINIGRHCYLCPYSRQYITSTYPTLPVTTESTIDGMEFVKEIVVDEFSLLLFHSPDDYKLFKEQEDKLREKEKEEEKRKLFEEKLRMGAVKKKGRKSKIDVEKEKLAAKKREKLERRELRRRDTHDLRMQQRHERREQRRLEEQDLSPEEKATRRAARQEAKERRREEKRRLRGERKLEEKRLKRQPKPQAQPRNNQAAESNGCEAHPSSSMAVGVAAALSHVDSNNSSSSRTQQTPSMEKSGAPGTEPESHVNGPSVIRLPDEEFRKMKRTPSAIGIAQMKAGVMLESGANGSGAQSPLAAMSKRRKTSHEGNPDMKGLLIGIASQQQSGDTQPTANPLLGLQLGNAQHASTSSTAVQKPFTNPLLFDPSGLLPGLPSSLLANPLLLLNPNMLAQSLNPGAQATQATQPMLPQHMNTLPNVAGLDPSLLLSAMSMLSGADGLLNGLSPLLMQNPQLLVHLLGEQQRKTQQSSTNAATSGNPMLHAAQLSQMRPACVNSAVDHHTTAQTVEAMSFPPGAALGSQLAGAAIFGSKPPQSTLSALNPLTNSMALLNNNNNKKRIAWCDTHVRIAHQIARHKEARKLSTAASSNARPSGACIGTPTHPSQSSSTAIGQHNTTHLLSSLHDKSLSGIGTAQGAQSLQALIAAGLLPASFISSSSALLQNQSPALLSGANPALLPSSISSLLPPLPSQLPPKVGLHSQHLHSLQSQGIQQNHHPMSSTTAFNSLSHSTPHLSMAPSAKLAPSMASSALGLPIVAPNIGASGSLTSGNSNAAAQQQQQTAHSKPLPGQLMGAQNSEAAITQLLLAQLGVPLPLASNLHQSAVSLPSALSSLVAGTPLAAFGNAANQNSLPAYSTLPSSATSSNKPNSATHLMAGQTNPSTDSLQAAMAWRTPKMEPANQSHHPSSSILGLGLPTSSAINNQNHKKLSVHQLPGANNNLSQHAANTSTSISSTMSSAPPKTMPARHESSPSAAGLGFVLPANFGALNPIEQELFMQQQIYSMLNGSMGRRPGLESGALPSTALAAATASITQQNHLAKMELARECTPNGATRSTMTASSSSQMNASPAATGNRVATTPADILGTLREKSSNT